VEKEFNKAKLLLLILLSQNFKQSLFAQFSAQINDTNCVDSLRESNFLSKDLYRRLGLHQNASQEDVKKAFRFLVTKVHADTGHKTPGDDPSLEHRNLNEAYEILSNPEKRRRYNILNPDSGLKKQNTYQKNNESSNRSYRRQQESKEEKNLRILQQFPFENTSTNAAVKKSFDKFSQMIDDSHDTLEAIIFSLKWHNSNTNGLKDLEARPPIQEGERAALKAIVRKYLPKLLEKNSPYELDALSEELQSIDPELSEALRIF
jgi:curved DNA-binding protein CbpA